MAPLCDGGGVATGAGFEAGFEAVWGGPVAGLDGVGLVERFRLLELERRHLEAELAELLGEVDRRGVFRDDQHASVKGWARALGRWSDGEARARARLSRLGRALPQVAEAIAVGGLGVAQAHELGRVFANPRVAGQLVEVIEIFLSYAELMSFESFQQMVRQWESIADADGSHREHAVSHRRRRASMFVFGTSVIVQACGGTVDGAQLIEIFERYQHAEFLTDWDQARAVHGPDATAAQLPRDAGQRAWDALLAIFRDAASVPADAQPPEPVLNIVADVHTFNEALQDFARLLANLDGADHDGTIAEFLRHHTPTPDTAPRTDDDVDDEADAEGQADEADQSDNDELEIEIEIEIDVDDEEIDDDDIDDGSGGPGEPGDGAVEAGTVEARAEAADLPPPRRRSIGGRSPDPRWWRCATVGGIPLPRSVLIEALLAGQVRRVIIDGAGVAVDVGRKRRFFTGPIKQALMLLTEHCVWTGCSRPARQSVADHTTDFQHGGHTATSNGGPMCNHHNLRKNLGYTVTRDTNGHWHTHRPDGTEIH